MVPINNTLVEDLKVALKKASEKNYNSKPIYTDPHNHPENGIPIVPLEENTLVSADEAFITHYRLGIHTLQRWFINTYNSRYNHGFFENDFLSEFVRSFCKEDEIIDCFFFELNAILKNEFEKFLFKNYPNDNSITRFHKLFVDKDLSKPEVTNETRDGNRSEYLNLKNQNDIYKKWKYIHLFAPNELKKLTDEFEKEKELGNLSLEFKESFIQNFGELATDVIIKYFSLVKRQYLYPIDFNLGRTNKELEDYLFARVLKEKSVVIENFYDKTFFENTNFENENSFYRNAIPVLDTIEGIICTFTEEKLKNKQLNFSSFFVSKIRKLLEESGIDINEEIDSKIDKKLHTVLHPDKIEQFKIELSEEEYKEFEKDLNDIYQKVKALDIIDITQEDADSVIELLKIEAIKVYTRYLMGKVSNPIPDYLLEGFQVQKEYNIIRSLLIQLKEIETTLSEKVRPSNCYFCMKEIKQKLSSENKILKEKYEKQKAQLIETINIYVDKLKTQYGIKEYEVSPVYYRPDDPEFDVLENEFSPHALMEYIIPFLVIDDITCINLADTE